MLRYDFEKYVTIAKEGKAAEVRSAFRKLLLEVVVQSYLYGDLTLEQYSDYIEYYVEVQKYA